MNKLFKRFGLSKNKSSILIWGMTFIISFLFVTSSTSLSTSAEQGDIRSSAGFKYLDSGFFPSSFVSLSDSIWGPDTTNIGVEASDKSGALDIVLGVTDTFYNEPPASGIVWAQDEINKIKGLNSVTVEAQADPNDVSLYFPGTGYTILKPISGLWQWSRNIVYFFFIIILVILAFFILFRKNLGGQVTVTLANSLPSIMWALLFVTLSYPISGLAIDVVYIGSGLVQSLFITGPGAPGNDLVNSTFIFNDDAGRTDINFLQPDDTDVSIWGIWSASNSQLCKNDDCSSSNILPDMEQNDVLTAVGNLLQGLVDATTSIKIGDNPLLILILGLATLQASLKLFLALAKEYIMLILLPVISPFIFMTAALPNRTMSALTSFIKSLAKSSLSFVAVYALFLFMIIIGQSHNFENSAFSSIADLKLIPPLLGYSQEQVLGGDSIIRTLIIFMLFMFAPSIPDLVGSLFNIKSGNEYVSKVGRDTAGAFKKVGSLVTGVTSKLS